MRKKSATRAPTLTYPPDIADKEALRAFLADTDIFGEARDEGASYLEHAFERFRITLAIAPEVPPDSPVLELGSNPYFFTRMLLGRGLDVRCANWFGDGAGPTGQQIVTGPSSGVTDVMDYDHFNIELDRFPYPDGSFRLVFFCEILEHLARDPVNALAEIHRVLDGDNGSLVLSTPNPARTENLVKMLNRFRDQGRNVADCLNKLKEMILSIAEPPKPRKKKKPSRAAKRRRLENKRRKSEKKQSRREKFDH